MRALIIENSRVYCLLLDNILGQQGFDSDICDGIENARLHADSRSYELVCISHHLKDGYGTEFVEYCRNHGINQDTPILYFTSNQNFSEELDSLAIDKIIFKLNKQQISHQINHFIQSHLDPIFAITGDTSDELRLSLYESGVNDFIRKPVLARELLVRIGNLITNKRLLDKVHDQRRELFALAATDKLTGCQNRHSLMHFSLKFIALSERQRYPISMLVIDLDHFKSINDNYGHAVGDVVLEAVGNLLNSFFREGDLVGFMVVKNLSF